MKNRVTIIPSDFVIIVDNIPLEVDFSPSQYIHAIQWYKGKGHIEFGEGPNQEISGEEDYDFYILPYVQLYCIEQTRLEQEKIKELEIFNSLPKVKERKRVEIKHAFRAEEVSGFVNSTLGFKADATRTAKQDIDGLIQSLEVSQIESIPFRDFSNQFHTLTLEQLKILQLEIIQKGLDLYEKKWQLEQLIDIATTKEELEQITW